MVTFQIHQGVTLNCTKKSLLPFVLYATDKDDEIAELRGLGEKFKLCTEVVSKEPEKKKGKEKPVDPPAPPAGGQTVDPVDDITDVHGVGAATEAKLKEKGITKKSELKAALKDTARTEEMKEVLGVNFEKILAQLKD